MVVPLFVGNALFFHKKKKYPTYLVSLLFIIHISVSPKQERVANAVYIDIIQMYELAIYVWPDHSYGLLLE